MNAFHFRKLGAAEKETFRQAARNNYELFTPIEGIWHPIYQIECVRLNFEAATFVEDKESED